MAHKYNKITKSDVLALFAEKEIINRKCICNKYNCSVYTVIRIVDELKDENKIKLVNWGYKLKNNK